MFGRKNQYLKIQKIHHKALKVVFNSDAGYDELLQMSNEITIHQKHLHASICEVFKSLVLASEYYYISVNNLLFNFLRKFITWKLSPDRVTFQ